MAPGDQRRTRGSRTLRVAVVDQDGRPMAAVGLSRWLARIAPASARGAVTVALVPDARVRMLNRTYRREDYATDVLSFASGMPKSPGGLLGEVVIAAGVARRQAREAGHVVDVELKILALHGLLHLLGYDHERDGGEMARVERRLRRKGGLRQSLTERAGAAGRSAAPEGKRPRRAGAPEGTRARRAAAPKSRRRSR